jgi:peptidoglycan/LPS O-acetylase OafA/YrhL
LVGGNIIRLKKRLSDTNESVFKMLLHFSARRILRIFPAYYLYLAILYLINYPEKIKSIILWLLLYGGNFLFYLKQHNYWPIGHLWSLAVEEQFYILLPLLILLLPSRFIAKTIIAFIVGSVTFQMVALHAGYNVVFTAMLLPACLGSFGMGIGLAYIQINGLSAERILRAFWPVALLYLFVSVPETGFIKGTKTLYYALPLFPFLVACGIYGITSGQIPKNMQRILTGKLLVSTGRVSYGIYLYHTLMMDFAIYLLVRVGVPVNCGTRFCLGFCLTLLISHFSYWAFESYFIKLKRYFL